MEFAKILYIDILNIVGNRLPDISAALSFHI